MSIKRKNTLIKPQRNVQLIIGKYTQMNMNYCTFSDTLEI